MWGRGFFKTLLVSVTNISVYVPFPACFFTAGLWFADSFTTVHSSFMCGGALAGSWVYRAVLRKQ